MIGGREAAKQYLISQGMWDHSRDLPVGALGDGNTVQPRDDVRELLREARERLAVFSCEGHNLSLNVATSHQTGMPDVKSHHIKSIRRAIARIDTALSQGDEQSDLPAIAAFHAAGGAGWEKANKDYYRKIAKAAIDTYLRGLK